MRAQLHAASVTLAFWSIVWCGFKISCTPTISAVTSGLIGPSHPSIAKRGRNADPFNASIDVSLAVNCPSTSYSSGIIGFEAVLREVANVNACKRMNFASNSALSKTPKFVDLGLSPANTADKLNSVFAPANRSKGLMDSPN